MVGLSASKLFALQSTASQKSLKRQRNREKERERNRERELDKERGGEEKERERARKREKQGERERERERLGKILFYLRHEGWQKKKDPAFHQGKLWL